MPCIDRPSLGPIRSAVFFDRDGTLTRDQGYTHRVEDLEWMPGAIEAIRVAQAAGHLVIVATNQSGVARGRFCLKQMHAFHAAMLEDLGRYGAKIDAFYFCPYHGHGIVSEFTISNHPDRKPHSGMLRRAMLEWGISPQNAVMIGDQDIDLEAANAVGMLGIKVASGDLETELMRKKLAFAQNPNAGEDLEQQVADRAHHARDWLFDTLLPFWWERGFDHVNGLFHEQFTPDGTPIDMPRRIMVQARQTYVFATAGRLGWQGPWRDAVRAGLRALIDLGVRSDGGTRHAVHADGSEADGRRNLYDLAFVIFALSEASIALDRDVEALVVAQGLLDWLQAHWLHPEGGYFEGEIGQGIPRSQNPHMHLLEALLAFETTTRQMGWSSGAGLHLANPLVTTFAAAATVVGAVVEFYDQALSPILDGPDGFVEPGHQFEWSYLLDWHDKLSGQDNSALVESLYRCAELRGVDLRQGMVHERVDRHGRPLQTTSRLWNHCERLKAAALRVRDHQDPLAAHAVCQSYDMIQSYYRAPTLAVSYERRCPDGGFIESNALASSLYHVVSALRGLLGLVGT